MSWGFWCEKNTSAPLTSIGNCGTARKTTECDEPVEISSVKSPLAILGVGIDSEPSIE